MLDLGSLQKQMAAALLDGRFDVLEGQVMAGPVGAAEAFGLHRNTVRYALTNALRLTFPTVDSLVGEAFFDQAALAFVAEHPPTRACLTGYGRDFPDFLACYPLAAGLPYLADVGRLDFAVEEVGGCALGRDGPVLDLGEAVMTLDASLRVLRLDAPAAAIRDALEGGDDGALAAIDLNPRPRSHALWRRPEGAAIRPLSPVSAAFLEGILAGASAEDALTAALATG